MANFLRTLAGDLLTLEVSTIIRENASSAKMPSMRRIALLQIADQYRDFIISGGYARKAPGPNHQPKEGEKHNYFRWRFGGEFSFIELKRVAEDARHDLMQKAKKMSGDEQIRAHKDAQLLLRIEEKSSNLIGVFKRQRKVFAKSIGGQIPGFADVCNLEGVVSDYQSFPSQMVSSGWNNDISIQDINNCEDIEFQPDDITLIRKVWEIGMEQILLQTSIQIDGDITTIMSREFVGMPDRTQSMLMRIHEDSVSSSTRIWKMLFETIGQLAGKAIHKIFDREAK